MSEEEKEIDQDVLEEELEKEKIIKIREQKRATPEVLTKAYKDIGEPIAKIIEVLNSDELYNPDRALLVQMLFSYILMHVGLTGYERVGVIDFVRHDIHIWVDYIKMKHAQGAFESKFKSEMQRQMDERGSNPFPV